MADDIANVCQKVQAFCMGKHLRLGKGSPVMAFLCDDVVRMIGQHAIRECHLDCINEHHLMLFMASSSVLRPSKRVRDVILSIVHDGSLLLARRLTPEKAKLVMLGTEVDEPFTDLKDVVWGLRSELQEHPLYGIAASQLCGSEFFFELHPSIVLPHWNMCCQDAKFCSGHYYTDPPTEPSPNPFYEGHIFPPGHTYVNDMGHDSLGHIHRTLADTASGNINEGILQLLLPWIAELFVLQACVFPILDRHTKTGFADTAPNSLSFCTSSTCFKFSVCHDCIGELGHRNGHSFSMCLRVHGGGRLVSIRVANFGLRKNAVFGCECIWCSKDPRNIETALDSDALFL